MTTFISAPFGNYLKFKNAVSVTGTWTYKPRPGLFKQVVKTLRYTRDGWRNKIGLRNRGIEYGIQKTNFNEVLSVSAISEHDWINLESIVPQSQSVELNISCPNLDVHEDTTTFNGFDLWPTTNRKWCIVKVPPTSSYSLLDKIVKLGFTQIHASNTLPTDKGGLSEASPKAMKIKSLTVKNIENSIEKLIKNESLKKSLQKTIYKHFYLTNDYISKKIDRYRDKLI